MFAGATGKKHYDKMRKVRNENKCLFSQLGNGHDEKKQMTTNYEFYSDVKNGKLQPNTSALIAESLKQFEGKRICITIGKIKSNRSSNQNRYFHSCISILAQEFGYTAEEMKDIIKYKFLLREKVDEKTGEVFKYIGETHKLSKEDFFELQQRMIQFSAEYGVILPLPGEIIEINFVE